MKIKRLSRKEKELLMKSLKITPSGLLDTQNIKYNNKELAVEKGLSLNSVEYLLRDFVSSEIRLGEWLGNNFVIKNLYCYRK